MCRLWLPSIILAVNNCFSRVSGEDMIPDSLLFLDIKIYSFRALIGDGLTEVSSCKDPGSRLRAPTFSIPT